MRTVLSDLRPAHVTLLTSAGEYKDIALPKFLAMLPGVESWSEQILIPAPLEDDYHRACEESSSNLKELNSNDVEQLGKVTSFSLSKLVAFVDRRHQGFGFDVVARHKIPADIHICTYVGEVYNIQTKPIAPYALSINMKVGVDAEKKRCLGSMFSHLPSKQDCEFTNPDDAKDVAFENLRGVQYLYRDPVSKKPNIIFFLKTMREILPGEIMGWDYGEKYWKGLSREPHFFTLTGVRKESIPPFKYVSINCKTPGATITSRVRRDAISELRGPFDILSSDDGECYAQTSSRLILDAFAKDPRTNSITVEGDWVQSNHATNMLLTLIMRKLSIPDAQWKAEDRGQTAFLSIPQHRMKSLPKIEKAFTEFESGQDPLGLSIRTVAQTTRIGLNNISLAKLQQISECIATKPSPLASIFFDGAATSGARQAIPVQRADAASPYTGASPAFFSENLGPDTRAELRRITSHTWKYSNRKSLAYLEMDQEQSLAYIRSHFEQEHVLVSPVQKVKDSNNWLISIESTELPKLRRMPVLTMSTAFSAGI